MAYAKVPSRLELLKKSIPELETMVKSLHLRKVNIRRTNESKEEKIGMILRHFQDLARKSKLFYEVPKEKGNGKKTAKKKQPKKNGSLQE